jgi:hypothetical protein
VISKIHVFARKMLIVFALALGATPAMADEYEFSRPDAKAKFAISLPEGWRVTSSLPSEIYFSTSTNPDLVAVAGVMPGRTPLADQLVVKHIDLSNRVVTRDTMVQQAGLPARRIDGTAVSEGDQLSFNSIAIKPAADAPVIQLEVFGPRNLWQRPDIKRLVEDMLGSFKPVRASP